MTDRYAAAMQSIDAKIGMLGSLAGMIHSDAFSNAVAAIERAEGRCIVTGIGKSGHIGRKIVATFNSTGQAAAFLHPAEAAHGDMGMIRPGDVVLMLSNSGETDELIPILDRTFYLGCAAIIMTSRPEATLPQRGGIVLAYPRGPEGCPLGKAPMASATAQLAIGDALASALMVASGFDVQDFAAIHHGGYLGRTIAQVA